MVDGRRVALVGATIVSLFVVLGAIGLSALLMFQEIPQANRELAIATLGGFAPLVGVVVKAWIDLLLRVYGTTTVVTQQQGTQEIKTQ